jgi:hypothetical protein
MVVGRGSGPRHREGMSVEQTPRTGAIKNVAILDLTSMRSPDDLAEISSIEKVALVLVPGSLAGALARIPTSSVASIVPVPDGAEVKVHTGSVVMGGEALANPGGDNVVLVVTGTLALSSPVEEVAYRQVIVTGMVLAPYGSETALGAGLSRLTGSVQYYRHAEGQRFRTFSGQTQISGETLANAGGNPADVLFIAGQTVVTGPVKEVGYQQIVAAGQLVAPRESEAVLSSVLTAEGQLVWYSGQPRFFIGNEHFSRDLFELLDEPLSMVLMGRFTIDEDVPAALLRDKVRDITLVGKIIAPKGLVGVLQLLTTEKHGTITVGPDEG